VTDLVHFTAFAIVRLNGHGDVHSGVTVTAALEAASPLPTDEIEIAVVSAWDEHAARQLSRSHPWARWGKRS
jgi:hypothetical protein